MSNRLHPARRRPRALPGGSKPAARHSPRHAPFCNCADRSEPDSRSCREGGVSSRAIPVIDALQWAVPRARLLPPPCHARARVASCSRCIGGRVTGAQMRGVCAAVRALARRGDTEGRVPPLHWPCRPRPSFFPSLPASTVHVCERWTTSPSCRSSILSATCCCGSVGCRKSPSARKAGTRPPATRLSGWAVEAGEWRG